MLKEAIGTAAGIDEARAAALAELNAPDDAEVKIEVLEMPTKKKFGLFGGTMAKVKASYESSPYAHVEGYLKTILNGLGVADAKISFEENDEEIRVCVECSGSYGSAIGRRGETLDSIQYLVRLVMNRGAEASKRVCLNIGNYREKREATLRSLAEKSAARVKKYGRNVVLDPMNPYERRIIHTTVQEIEGVSSHSVGPESERKVVITPEGDYRRQGSGAPRRGRNDRDFRDKPRRDSRPPQNFSGSASRPPRSDAATASRYGKIEPNK